MKHKIHLLTPVLISLIAALTGCTAGYVAPPDGSPTMAQVYNLGNEGKTIYADADSQEENATLAPSAMPPVITAQASSTIQALNTQFPLLPNPQSLMYIFGHYADGGEIPVPGHFIAFSLYKQNYYALPSEVQMPINDGQSGEVQA